MKLRHVLVACAAASALQAQAADVQVYGLIDTGLSFKSVDADNKKGRKESVEMGQSQLVPNRWGLRGTEDLGNGLKVGFVLEGQFASDTGTMTGNRLFHRSAQVSLISQDYGTLNLGRSGALRSGFGTTGIWGPKTNPFSNAAGSFIAGHKWIMPGGFKAVDNAVTYQSPVWAGAQLHLQYSSRIDGVTEDDEAVENRDSTDRQWAVGLTYANGPLRAVAVLDQVMYKTVKPHNTNPERGTALSAEVDYKFDVAKLYLSGMWFNDMAKKEFQGHAFNGVNLLSATAYQGYVVEVGADIPAAGGTVKVNLGWMDAESSEGTAKKAQDTDRLTVGVGYTYPLSKRTQLYTAAGYLRDSYKLQTSGAKETNPDAYEVIAGMVHRF